MKKALMMIAAWVAMAMCVWADDGANGAVNPSDGYVQVRLGCDQAMGKVKGAKILKLDSKGTAKTRINATAARGYVFAGWYLDPDFSQPASFVTGSGENAKPKDYRYAAQSLTVTGDVSLFARFVEKTAESDPIEHLRFLGAGYCGADASEFAEEETWYQGVALPTNGCAVAFGSASLPKVTIKGLPAGVKCDDVRRCFAGAPKKAGEFTLTVTVKNKSGATDVLTKRVKVEPLPGWAVGSTVTASSAARRAARSRRPSVRPAWCAARRRADSRPRRSARRASATCSRWTARTSSTWLRSRSGPRSAGRSP